MNEILLIDSLRADQIIFLCLFAGGVARICNVSKIDRSLIGAGKEIVFGIIIGGAFVGFATVWPWFNTWKLKSFWWMAIMASFFSTTLVGIVQTKLDDIMKLPLKEGLKFIWKEFKDEIKDYLLKSKKS
ncbi:MAG: hypothetical protein EOO39_30645 [Cytophagaceae bacterium]|nr:MAG: hypothetical protein EOO39_30645 [Cytophagaceae bacterium]